MPRKEQIKSVNTKHSPFSYTVTPGTAFTDILTATINPYLITDTPGGAQVDTPAFVFGTNTESFTILAGDSINITVDAGFPILVTFAGTDTTASTISSRINGTVGIPANFSRNLNGRVLLKSPTIGLTSQIVLSDGVPGTLTKLGMVAGTVTGATAPVRGVLTKSPDLYGGVVSLSTTDGKSLVTDCSGIQPILALVANEYLATPIVPGGHPIHGRLTQTTTGYRISYATYLPTRGSVVTDANNSTNPLYPHDFAVLDGTDSFTITIDGTPTVITFPAGPGLTTAQVADRINTLTSAVWMAGGSGLGRAEINGAGVSPFNMPGSDFFTISIDGNPNVNVVFSPADITATNVAATINAAIGVQGTASVITDAFSNQTIRIFSNNSNGRTSSIRLIVGQGFTGPSLALNKLGLAPGFYRGFSVANLYGNAEITISNPGRGSVFTLAISGTAQTLGRMGLAAGSFNGSDTSAEEFVSAPSLDWVTPVAFLANSLIQEVLEFGEILASGEATLEQFNQVSTGTNALSSGANESAYVGVSDLTVSPGLRDVGKPVIVGVNGQIPTTYLNTITVQNSKIFKKFIRGNIDVGEVLALVAKIIETPGTNGNALPKSGTFVIDVDPDNTFPAANGFFFRQGRDVNPLNIPFFIQRGGGGPSGANWRASGGYAGNPFAWGSDINLFNFYDVNTIAAGGGGVIPLTTNTFARTVRVWEQESAGTSLLFNLQARETVTCGDGVNSFGDFNGPTALYQAIAYFTTQTTFNQGKIKLKAGTFTINAINGTLTIPSNRSITIEGWGAVASVISVAAGVTNATLNAGFSSLHFKDLSITKAASPFAIVGVAFGANVKVTDCIFSNVTIQLLDATYQLKDSFFSCNSATANRPIIEIVGNSGSVIGPFKSFNCTFNSGQDNAVLKVSSFSAVSPLTKFRDILFEDCEMNLMSTTGGGGFMLGNPGVLDVFPNGSSSYTGTGCVIQNILYKNCRVRANTAAGAISTLVYYVPQGNGNSYTTGERLDIARFEIDGGSWLAPSSNTLFNPFTLLQPALATTTDGFLGSPLGRASEDGGVFLRSVLFGFDDFTSITGVNQGKATTDCDDELWNGGPGDAAPALSAEWAAWTINSRYIDIKDVKFVGMSQLGNSGDLFIKYDKLMIDGVSFNEYKQGGPGVAPLFRLKYRPTQTDPSNYNSSQHAIVKNVVLSGKEAPTGWCTAGFGSFVHIDPNSDQGVISAKGRVIIDGLVIEGFLFGTFPGPYFPALTAAITLNGSATTGSLYTGSVASYRNITVKNCEIGNCGPLFVHTTITDAQIRYISNLVLENNKAIGCAGDIINIQNANSKTASDYVGWDTITIKGNIITGCSGLGIKVLQDLWSFAGFAVSSSVIITDNAIYNNNTLATNDQIYVGVLGIAANLVPLSAKFGPAGILMGNSCGVSTVTTPGKIHLNQIDAAGTAVAAINTPGSISSSFQLRGAYTDIATIVVPNTYKWANGDLMVLNNAKLNSSP